MLTYISVWLQHFLGDEEGASAIEYGLIVGLIAVALITVLTLIGGDDGLRGLFQSVADQIPSGGGGDGAGA